MIRTSDQGGFNQMLSTEDGRTTSHIQGFLNRTIKLMEGGIRPIYVFDGKPPDLKIGELRKRKAVKEKAHKEIKEALDKFDEPDTKESLVEDTQDTQDTQDKLVDEVNKLSKRTVRVTKEHNEEV